MGFLNPDDNVHNIRENTPNRNEQIEKAAVMMKACKHAIEVLFVGGDIKGAAEALREIALDIESESEPESSTD